MAHQPSKKPEKPATDPTHTDEKQPDEHANDQSSGSTKSETPDPTRYGDWEKNGRCIDF